MTNGIEEPHDMSLAAGEYVLGLMDDAARADFEARTAELADFVARACSAYGLAPPIVLGFSNGANIGWGLMRFDPSLIAGALLMRASLPFDPRPLPDLSVADAMRIVPCMRLTLARPDATRSR